MSNGDDSFNKIFGMDIRKTGLSAFVVLFLAAVGTYVQAQQELVVLQNEIKHMQGNIGELKIILKRDGAFSSVDGTRLRSELKLYIDTRCDIFGERVDAIEKRLNRLESGDQ